jgi:glycosyltransferase involved in cell wall biosynthesis
MKSNKKRVMVVMPAYNAERTLEKVYKDIPKNVVQSILLVDDGSRDKTVQLSKKLRIKTIVHTKNKGYGANQKTCYTYALKEKVDYVIMLHPDGQYNPKDIGKFVKALSHADVVMGSRFLRQGHNETPFYKLISLKIIAMIFNLVLGTHLTEVNTGYRGYSAQLLRTIPFKKNGNGYIFDPQALLQAVYYGFSIKEVSVSKKYNKEASSPNFKKSLEHGLENMYLLLQYLLHKYKITDADFLSRK